MSLEIRSGISKTRIFFERILLSKAWTIGIYIFFTMIVLIFALTASSLVYSTFLMNLSVGFIIVFLYDLFLTAVLATLSTFGFNLALGMFGVLIFLLSAITPLVPSIGQMIDKTWTSQYTTSGEAYKNYESYIIANDVRTLANKYPKGFTEKMLNSYSDLKGSILLKEDSSISNPNDEYKPIEEQKKIYDIAISGLLTEFKEGILRKEGEYKSSDSFNKSAIFEHLSAIKDIFPKQVYDSSNDYGEKIWEKSFYHTITPKIPNSKFDFAFDSEYGFNNLFKKLNENEQDQEKKEFYKIIDRIIKNSFVIFNGDHLFLDTRTWDKWNIIIAKNGDNCKDENKWLEQVSITVGARMYQTAFIKAINSAINLPYPVNSNNTEQNLSTYYYKAKIDLYMNPWTMFNKILSANYYGDVLIGNRIEQEAFNKSWVDKEVILELDNEKPNKEEIFNNLKTSNFVKLEIKNKVFHPIIAIVVYTLILILITFGSFFIFKLKMKKAS
ncbi:hypothetical protein [Williamsoniiplasma lucivorax]|nr:hypothetical protein [Williamsoniiplasma lucivorax]